MAERIARAGSEERPALRALVADTAAGSRMSLSATLKSFDPGITIVETSEGRETLDSLMRETPDIAFVNVHLPGMSGAEAVAVARHQGARPLTLLMIDGVMKHWVDLSVELDAYEFLKKPVDIGHVTALLKNTRRMRETLRLLVVDDSETARTLVRRVFERSRFSVVIDETDSGRHALKLMQMTAYDLALIDQNLAGLDGLETACQAREVAPDTQLLMMTSSPSDTLPGALRHFGIAAMLRKPFYIRDVEKVFHKLYGLRRPYLMNALTPETEAKARVAAMR